jgi:hypothetical protein
MTRRRRKDEVSRMWKVGAKTVPVITAALGTIMNEL